MFHINYYLMFHGRLFNKFMYYSNALTYIFKLGALIYPFLYPEDFEQRLAHRLTLNVD